MRHAGRADAAVANGLRLERGRDLVVCSPRRKERADLDATYSISRVKWRARLIRRCDLYLQVNQVGRSG